LKVEGAPAAAGERVDLHLFVNRFDCVRTSAEHVVEALYGVGALDLGADRLGLVADDAERAIGEEKLHDGAEDVARACRLLAIVVVGEDDLALAHDPANEVSIRALAHESVALAGGEQEAEVTRVQRQRWPKLATSPA